MMEWVYVVWRKEDVLGIYSNREAAIAHWQYLRDRFPGDHNMDVGWQRRRVLDKHNPGGWKAGIA